MFTRRQPGDMIYGAYTVERLIGVGATSSVYACSPRHRAPGMGETVAVKVMHDRLLHDARGRERFLREAALLRSLEHPNIVRIFEIIDAPETVAIAMEYVDGPTLMEWQGQAAHAGMDVELCEVFVGLLRGLGFAHQHGIVHRDLKPANVLVGHTPEGAEATVEAKIIDFGVARRLQDGPDPEDFHTIRGTAAYISPDELRSPHEVCASSDLYSIGVMLYELSAGQRPFTSRSAPELFRAHLNQAPTPPSMLNPSVGPALEDVILRSLAKRPEQRFQDAEALRAALEQALNLAWEIRTHQWTRPTLPPASPALAQYRPRPWWVSLQETLGSVLTALFNPGRIGGPSDPHYLERPHVELHGMV